jgi:hypothetical protein
MSNFDLQYRPLCLGTSIINGRVKEPGTLGLFGKDEAGAAWLISCYHVLCDGGLAKYSQDDVIYQPAAAAASYAVAKTDVSRANIDLDCAAALLSSGMEARAWIPGIGPISVTATPTLNARVIKVGAAGGITEGIITQVRGSSVMIRSDPDFPQDYVISQPGDSGALWIDQNNRAAVALHRGIRGPRTATATSIDAVLEGLHLTLV